MFPVMTQMTSLVIRKSFREHSTCNISLTYTPSMCVQPHDHKQQSSKRQFKPVMCKLEGLDAKHPPSSMAFVQNGFQKAIRRLVLQLAKHANSKHTARLHSFGQLKGLVHAEVREVILLGTKKQINDEDVNDLVTSGTSLTSDRYATHNPSGLPVSSSACRNVRPYPKTNPIEIYLGP